MRTIQVSISETLAHYDDGKGDGTPRRAWCVLREALCTLALDVDANTFLRCNGVQCDQCGFFIDGDEEYDFDAVYARRCAARVWASCEQYDIELLP